MRLKQIFSKNPNIVIPSDGCATKVASGIVSSGVKIKNVMLALLVSIFSPLFAVEQIKQDAANADFGKEINVKAYDRYTGDLYVGTIAANGDYTIAKAGRDASVFTGLSTNADAAQVAKLPDLFAIASTDGTGADYVAFNTDANAGATGMSAISAAGGAVVAMAALGTNDEDITLSDGTKAITISKIAGGYFSGDDETAAGAYFFVRSRAGAANDFTALSGIKGFRVNAAGDAFEGVGAGGQKNALKYDLTKGAAGDGAALRHGSTTAALGAGDNSVKDLYWDPELKTLFIASKLKVPTAGADDYLMAISKVTFNSENANQILLTDVLPSGQNGADNDLTNIFTISKPEFANIAYSPGINKIRTMHTSTGMVYLIVNGDINTLTNGNKFYALRYDPETGYVVQNDLDKTELANGFKRTDGGVGQSLDGGNVGSLVIGGTVAPWDGGFVATDMEVVGDTVYVSLAVARDATNDPGVWASTAMFDRYGVINAWTAWERVMPSNGEIDQRDAVKFFAVDGVNGKLWTVDFTNGDKPITVNRSNWLTSGFEANSLPGTINTSFAENTYSDVTCSLDIPMNTPGVTHIHDNADKLTSLTMIGGYEKVDFAKTSASFDDGVGQKPTTDFSVANMYVKTTLEGAGTVRCLGASRQPVDQTYGYFFAGTDNGLWVWASNQANHPGYNGNNAIDATAADPFENASWYQFDKDKISGPVTAMDSDGVFLYLIEQDTKSSAGTIISKLWRISIENFLIDMEAVGSVEVIAQSGKDEIPANTIFTDFKLLTDREGKRTDNKIICILSTDRGLFVPGKQLKMYNDVTGDIDNPNGPTGQWLVKRVGEAFSTGSLFAPKRVPVVPATNDGVNHKIIANGLVDDSNGLGYYQRTELKQANVDSSGYFTINNYTNGSMASGTDTLTYLNNRALSFWTDGGRRFYTRRNVGASWGNESKFEMIQSLPYNAAEWNMTEPYGDEAIQGQTIYWIESISGLGIILAGTPNGVIALQ